MKNIFSSPPAEVLTVLHQRKSMPTSSQINVCLQFMKDQLLTRTFCKERMSYDYNWPTYSLNNINVLKGIFKEGEYNEQIAVPFKLTSSYSNTPYALKAIDVTSEYSAIAMNLAHSKLGPIELTLFNCSKITRGNKLLLHMNQVNSQINRALTRSLFSSIEAGLYGYKELRTKSFISMRSQAQLVSELNYIRKKFPHLKERESLFVTVSPQWDKQQILSRLGAESNVSLNFWEPILSEEHPREEESLIFIPSFGKYNFSIEVHNFIKKIPYSYIVATAVNIYWGISFESYAPIIQSVKESEGIRRFLRLF